MLRFYKHYGRDDCFKCIYCGRYVSYDRRKTIVKQITTSYFDTSQEQWYPEEEVEMYHKKCKPKKE